MKKIIYFSRFDINNSKNGGGIRRTSQIVRTLRDSHFNVKHYTIIRKFPKFDTTEYKDFKRVNYWSDEFSKQAYLYNHHAIKMPNHLINKSEVAFIDDPLFFKPLFNKLKSNNIPVVAWCQNIESLVNGQGGDKYKLLKEEIDILSRADLVVTISREDASLLKNFGVDSVFFPYYPKFGDQTELKEIRKKRMTSNKSNYLLIGNASNPANGSAMEKIIQYWNKKGFGNDNNKLIVGGYNTSTLQQFTQRNDNIEFRGELSDQEYKQLMIETKCIIIYQENSTGMLTRIVDSLISGVPVVANSCSARTFYNSQGLIEYVDLDDLSRALNELNSFNLPVLAPQKPYLGDLLSKIGKLTG